MWVACGFCSIPVGVVLCEGLSRAIAAAPLARGVEGRPRVRIDPVRAWARRSRRPSSRSTAGLVWRWRDSTRFAPFSTPSTGIAQFLWALKGADGARVPEERSTGAPGPVCTPPTPPTPPTPRSRHFRSPRHGHQMRSVSTRTPGNAAASSSLARTQSSMSRLTMRVSESFRTIEPRLVKASVTSESGIIGPREWR